MSRRDTATLAGGCFWCLEAVFQELRGVEGVRSGYAGGDVPDPSYEAVCTGTTGHAEVVQITFDPDAIAFSDLLQVFFTIHDPTTLNRQGPDVGTQYRSAIFYHDDAQRREAERAIAELDAASTWEAKIVTQVVPLTTFYPAEEYHRDYFRRNPGQAYCRAVVAPKVAKARKAFFERLQRPADGGRPAGPPYLPGDPNPEAPMADIVKRAEYSYATVDDQSGEGARLLEALKREGVNLVAFHAFPSGAGKSQVDLFAEDPAKLAAAAQKAGVKLSAKKHALLIEGADRPGAMADVLAKLASAKINVTAGEGVRTTGGRFGGIVWVKPADLDKAAQALEAR